MSFVNHRKGPVPSHSLLPFITTGIHPGNVPDMTVQISEGTTIHPTVVLYLARVNLATQGSCLLGKAVHLRFRRHTDAQQRLADLRGIRHLPVFWEEALVEWLAQKHDFKWRRMGRLLIGLVEMEIHRDRNHGGIFVREGLVLHKAQGGVEFDRLLEIGNWDVYEDGCLVIRGDRHYDGPEVFKLSVQKSWICCGLKNSRLVKIERASTVRILSFYDLDVGATFLRRIRNFMN